MNSVCVEEGVRFRQSIFIWSSCGTYSAPKYFRLTEMRLSFGCWGKMVWWTIDEKWMEKKWDPPPVTVENSRQKTYDDRYSFFTNVADRDDFWEEEEEMFANSKMQQVWS